ncbi:MAG TPA: HAMP domain-containing sensor histidine kinase [Actinomycetota bacterium]|nr:HAMP domain-containing sensor histidine kinase [Actinomycetota bacterium]
MDRSGNPRVFVEDASRALRDPLTICVGYLERLREDDPDERHKTVALVVQELGRMARLVDDLEVLSQAEQPDFLQRETIDLAAFTGELSEDARALGPRHWAVDRAGEGSIVADRERLTVAMMNLADNAVQHTVVDETIALGSSQIGDEVRLWVRDAGRGVSPSDEPHIFERFARGEGAHRRYRGGGLGLAVVKVVAEAHGGYVAMESRLEEGATFTIVIPRSPSDDVSGG